MTLGGGPLTTIFTTGHSTYVTGSPGYSTYTVDFQTSRTIGFYNTIGKVFGTTTNAQYSAFNWRDDFKNGFVVGGAFGMDFGDGWRGELELAYRSNDVDSGGNFRRMNTGVLSQFSYVATATRKSYRYGYSSSSILYTNTSAYSVGVGTATGTLTILAGSTTGLGPYKGTGTTTPLSGSATGRFSSGGEANTWSIMANLWYDYDLGNNVVAIVGGGIGAAHLDLEYNASMATYFSGTANYRLDDSGWGFAYQVGAGLGYDLGGGMMLSAQYRYFATTDIDVGNTDLAVQSHNFLVGLNIPLGGN